MKFSDIKENWIKIQWSLDGKAKILNTHWSEGVNKKGKKDKNLGNNIQLWPLKIRYNSL